MLAEHVIEWTERWKAEGLQQGLQQGEILVLRRLLTRRFGLLPNWVEQRLLGMGGLTRLQNPSGTR